MTLNPSLREAMLAAVPSLRAFAISLSGNIDRADDLVQETLLRAIANIDSFQPGTNMSAWIKPPAPSWPPAAAASARKPFQAQRKSPGLRPGEPVCSDVVARA